MYTNFTQCAPLFVILISLFIGGCSSGEGTGGSNNEFPAISGTPATFVRAGDYYEFQPDASDPDGNNLTFDAENLPDWLTLDVTTGHISGTPEKPDIDQYDDIIISASDGIATVFLPPLRLEVLPPLLDQSNFKTTGVNVPTEDGFESSGKVTFDHGDGSSQTFEDSELAFEFNDDNELTSLNGDATLSGSLVPGLEVGSQTNAGIGMYFGSELNANDAINILLKDERQYYAFFINTGLDLNLSNPDGSSPETHTISTPASGTIVIIIDPYDTMHYHYGETPLIGEYGEAKSKSGLLPFVPSLDHSELDRFDGHRFTTGSFSVGIKVFDLLSFSGQRIIKEPSFSDIDFEDPFNSPIEFKTGFNGQAEFAFGVFGFGLFSFEIADASATLDVGFDRQSFAMQTVIAPDVSWAPGWFPFLPTTEVIGDFFVNGAGDFEASLAGSYESTIPSANVNGKITVSQGKVTMAGEVIDRIRLPISVTFFENRTEAVIGLEVGFASEISEAVTAGFDRAEQAVDDAVAQIEQAISDFEFEVSLRGLRSAIPGIADTAITKLEAIPGTLRTSVDSAVVTAIKNKTVCKKKFGITYCRDAKDYVNESELGDTAGESAKSTATSRIAPYLAVFEELKLRAQQADDETLRTALEQALRAAYDNRRFDESIKVTVDLGSYTIIGISFDFGSISHTEQVTVNILTTDQADNILTAANNVYRIQQTSDLIVSAEDHLDEIPTKEVISEARTQVEAGIKQVPDVESVGYIIEGGVYTATVKLSNGSEYSVAFNVLSVDEAIEGIGDLLARYVIEN